MTILLALAVVTSALPTVPGAVDPAVTQDNIQTTICVPGYAGAHRPEQKITEPYKRKLLKGRPGKLGDFELDHAIAISLGGALFDPANLWLQKLRGKYGALKKDRAERKLYALVCKGKVTLIDAQHMLVADWIGAYRRYVGPLK